MQLVQLILFVLGSHLIGDFYLQSRKIAVKKSDSIVSLLTHTTAYSLFMGYALLVYLCIIDLGSYEHFLLIVTNCFKFTIITFIFHTIDISYNPALGTGQIQIRDIHYVTIQKRTAWEFIELLDKKYIASSKRSVDDWMALATKYNWIK